METSVPDDRMRSDVGRQAVGLSVNCFQNVYFRLHNTSPESNALILQLLRDCMTTVVVICKTIYMSVSWRLIDFRSSQAAAQHHILTF